MIENILVFYGENEYEIENNIKKNQLDYEIKEIEDIKTQADNFVTNLKNILD